MLSKYKFIAMTLVSLWALSTKAEVISVQKSGLVLEVRGQNIQQQPANGSAAQNFVLQNLSNGKVKILAGSQCLSGASASQVILLAACADSADQQFTISAWGDGYSNIKTPSGKCFNILYGDSVAGRVVIQYTCNGSGEQKFKVGAVVTPAPSPSPSPSASPSPTVSPSPAPSPISSGGSIIRSQKSGLVLQAVGTGLQQQVVNGSAAQQFVIQGLSNGKKKILAGSLCVSAPSGSQAVSVVSCSESATDQQFLIADISGGSSDIRGISGKCFNVQYGDAVAGRIIHQYTCNGSSEQKFSISSSSTPVPTPTPSPSPTPAPTVIPSPSPIPGGAIKIMPMGDSLTYGFLGESTGGYRGPLYAMLKNAGHNISFVGSMNCKIPVASPMCEGHSGWTIQQIDQDVVQAGLLEGANPDIIILMIGGNTLLKNPVNGVELALAQLPALLDRIYAHVPNVHIIVASTTRGNIQNYAAMVQAYNAGIPGVVAQKQREGRSIAFFDMYPVVPLSDMPDMLHPNVTGYQKMADAWFSVLDAILP